MKNPQYDSKDVTNLAHKLCSALRSLTFAPEVALDPQYVTVFLVDYWSFERARLDKIVDHLSSLFPNIATATLGQRSLRMVMNIAQNIGRKHIDPEVFECAEPEELLQHMEIDTEHLTQCLATLTVDGDSQIQELLHGSIRELLEYLASSIHGYRVLVPLNGVLLEVEDYELGDVKLVRLHSEPIQNPPLTQSTRATSLLDQPVGYEQSTCYVQVDTVGDEVYAQIRAMKLAQAVAMVLNLHVGSCYDRTTGLPPIYVPIAMRGLVR